MQDVEIKKGFSRGEHYHSIITEHYIITGKIECREEDINSQKENVKIIFESEVVKIPANVAHLFTALEDSVFMECSKSFEATYYPRYRKIVDEKMIAKS